MYPVMEVYPEKVKHNTKVIVSKATKKGLDVYGVTKVFCALDEVSQAMIDGGVKGLADSRIENLKSLQKFDVPKVLLRIVMPSEVEEVVKYTELSFNSELSTIHLLNDAASKQNKVHDILLMFDLGDLREGIFFESEYIEIVEDILKLENINLKGIGVNLTCYGGVIPYPKTLDYLLNIKVEIETKFNHKLDIISAGNSSTLHLIESNTIDEKFNNLRLGESLVLGYETAFGERIENTYDDAFILKAQIVELKDKPSMPIGEIGRDAFGNKPVFEDKGPMKRGILGIGRQDVTPDNLIPFDSNIEVIGASSDHLIVDFTKAKKEYKVGDVIDFKLTYGSLLALSTSKYVKKVIK